MISQPIFIIGSGRSGTTILYNLLAAHPEVCWLSEFSDAHAPSSFAPLLHRLLDVPGIGMALKKKIIASQRNIFLLYPSEGERIYHTLSRFEQEKYTKTYNTKNIDVKLFNAYISSHIQHTGKPRFINKQTANTQRLLLMNKLFPDAYWIHIIRDGRAVAHSLSKVSWWPNTKLWWLGKTPAEWSPDGEKWLQLGAKHWQRNVSHIKSCAKLLHPRYLEIRYEQLVKHPKKTLESVIKFTQLSENTEYFSLIPNKLYNGNLKWRYALTKNERKLLEKTIGPYLRSLNYLSK